jgi:chemotaxis protein CheD
MRTLVVGVGDARLSGDKGVRLVTYALASCVGIAIYDSVSGVGGIVHYLLPDSRLDRVKAKELPWMFADSAIPMFFRQAYRLGAKKSRLRVAVAGGAQVLEAANSMEIGRKNLAAMRRIFEIAGISPDMEDVGGKDVRSLRLDVGTGRLVVGRNSVERREFLLQSDAG